MGLQTISVPDSIKQLPYGDNAERLIDLANERIEAFMLMDGSVIENFVTCDFHLVDQAIGWMIDNHLATGNQFCELGSGFGAVAMLASLRGMDSIGIEIESRLVEQSVRLADDFGVDVEFYCDSFVPRDVDGLDEWTTEVSNVDTEASDVYDEIGADLDDFDVFFAFPWPGEHGFFEAVFEARAAVGALLMTYRGRDGIHLIRKI
ncbi:hypothetical protein K227x_39040 [Rubripirellula lacrimiformis]|uniref:Ribosomal protein L11 methyltransferase n=1 Tax=Rubripirellula lacrimiformis TaxID=1930273 RepID=A0A517NEE5_9BACT|nr:hypothetical protein [Rubripirellula lacrimiformis]QDT05504.1 hypothetical protein K227x_39040 [Rubripirellula lacrimiformis]